VRSATRKVPPRGVELISNPPPSKGGARGGIREHYNTSVVQG
jgi:hypothetical protein